VEDDCVARAREEAKVWYQITPKAMRGRHFKLYSVDFDFDEHGLLKFQVQNWLSGHEYAFIIRHYRAYLQCYPDKMQLSEKGHPANIYEQPKGMVIILPNNPCASWAAVLYPGVAPEGVRVPSRPGYQKAVQVEEDEFHYGFAQEEPTLHLPGGGSCL